MSGVITRVPSSYQYHLILKTKNGLSASLAISTSIKNMVTTATATATATASSSSNSGEYRSMTERVSLEKEIKKSKFIAIAAPISNEESAFSFLSEVRDPRATHNCWAFKVGQHSRCNDDGEPSGTAGKPIQSAILSSHIDRVMVVVIRYFGGIKLGTGGLVRAYGGVASECLRNAPPCLVKSKVPMAVEVPFDLLGLVQHQLQHFQVEDIKQDYETGKDGFAMVSFKVDFDQVEKLEDTVKANCSRQLVFYKRSGEVADIVVGLIGSLGMGSGVDGSDSVTSGMVGTVGSKGIFGKDGILVLANGGIKA
ncbi:unnamed protein product [Dovyalis caffra]|uniref:Impact N-terminal domain-containing protein n=1 Tax=Dovyalis caffra TaxID=77055 RepID=A0AAV1RTD1_9ROSI|nr:unnamed protein product [Dovyalis caffra]